MIPFSRLQYEIELLDDHAPIGLWGTRLRGGYGDVLKKELCVEPDRTECPGCPCFKDRTCDFPFLFKPHRDLIGDIPQGHPLRRITNLPPPFVINSPQNIDIELKRGSRLVFDFVAFGPTLERIMRSIDSVGRLGEQGLDVRLRNAALGKARFHLLDLCDMLAGGRSLYSRGNVGRPITVDCGQYAEALTPRHLPDEIVVEFVTPVVNFAKDCPELPKAAIDRKGNRARGLNDVYQLVRLLTNRIGLLWQVYGDDWPGQADFFRWQNMYLKASKAVSIRDMELERVSQQWFSKRQDQTLITEGFTGAMRVSGDLGELFGLLLLGEVFHIGESTAKGFGAIKIAY